MDIAWNGMLTCDYERSRPDASPLERELYTRSLTAWPAVFLGSSRPYGSLRRPGIVDIPEPDHHQLLFDLHGHLADPARAREVARRAAVHRHDAATALEQAERSEPGSDAAAAVAAATAAVLTVMSAHIVNWLLPEDHWETRIAKLLGSRLAARDCIAALSIPATAGHLLARLADVTRPLSHSGAGPGQFRQARTSAADRRNYWLAAALVAAAGDAPALDAVRAMAITLEWAAESEERRRDLRERYLALAGAWCAHSGLNIHAITVDDIYTAAGT